MYSRLGFKAFIYKGKLYYFNTHQRHTHRFQSPFVTTDKLPAKRKE